MAFKPKGAAPAAATVKKGEGAPAPAAPAAAASAPAPAARPPFKKGGNEEFPPSAFCVGTVTGTEPVNGSQGERIGNRVSIEISAYCSNGRDGADSAFLDALTGETKVVCFLSLPFAKNGENRYIRISKLQVAREHAAETGGESDPA